MIIWWIWPLLALFLLFGLVVFRGAPYVPSKKGNLKEAFTDLYPLGEFDLLVDIGSGDGVVLREAAKRGAKAVGYEINPVLVLISKWLSRRSPTVTIRLADFWSVKLPNDTTIIYTFGETRDILKMANKVASEASRLNKSLYFMSYAFQVPNLKPVKQNGSHFLYKIDPLHSSKAQV
jgi:SAM-dependent methyltransferase